jgi:DmsE family decaheme c-type cytochrome
VVSFRNNIRIVVWLLLALPLQAGAGEGWLEGLLGDREPVYTRQGADACLHCHPGERMRSLAESAHCNEQHGHTPFSEHDCESCHGPGSFHVSRAHGGQGFPPMTYFGRGDKASPREEQVSACLNCHNSPDLGGSTIVFRGSAHDRRNINCSTCHEIHVSSDPILARGNQAGACFRCHRKQREDHPTVGKRPINFERFGCGACHDVHAPAEVSGE